MVDVSKTGMQDSNIWLNSPTIHTITAEFEGQQMSAIIELAEANKAKYGAYEYKYDEANNVINVYHVGLASTETVTDSGDTQIKNPYTGDDYNVVLMIIALIISAVFAYYASEKKRQLNK